MKSWSRGGGAWLPPLKCHHLSHHPADGVQGQARLDTSLVNAFIQRPSGSPQRRFPGANPNGSPSPFAGPDLWMPTAVTPLWCSRAALAGG